MQRAWCKVEKKTIGFTRRGEPIARLVDRECVADVLFFLAMGGGNGNKSMIQRERNAKKLAASKKGSGVNQKVAAQKALTLLCQICRTSFMSTSDYATLKTHTDAKHSKEKFSRCFPEYPEPEAE